MKNTNKSPQTRPTTVCESRVDDHQGGDDRRPSDRRHAPGPGRGAWSTYLCSAGAFEEQGTHGSIARWERDS